jgi:hypothetical protein
MSKSIESLVSFSAGEWSSTLTARVDQQKYRAACIQARNMLLLKTGPGTRRPGTQMIAPTKVIPGGNYCARPEEFQFSINTAFMLEFGHHYIRFYSNGAQVTLSTAPSWVTATDYPAGSFVTDPTNTQIYYSAGGINGSTTQPHSDATNWVQQNIYEVPSPYDAAVGSGGLPATEVFQLQCCPINDVVYITQANHPRQKLIRYADTDWSMEPVFDLTPALLDQNATDVTISSASTTGQTLLTASAPSWATSTSYNIDSSVLAGGIIYNCTFPHISGTFANDLASGYWSVVTMFLPAHVGAYWELAYLRDSAYVEYDGTAAGGFAAGTSSTITAFGAWEVHTYGVWSADIEVQSSSDGGITWQTVRTTTGRNDRNVDITGTAAQAQLYRLVITNVSVPPTAGPTNPRVVFECVDAFLYGIVQITQVAIAAASVMVSGTTYAIQAVGTVNWGALGAPVGFTVGTVFQYNGASISGSGGTVTTPYLAVADVITQLTVADAWVSGQGYVVGDRTGYNGVNYICNTAVTGSTPPPSDSGHWTADGWPTIYWSEGSWSGVRGYPSAITAFEQRVFCGYTAYEPQRVWGTQQNDIENWDLGDQTLATDGVAFDLDAVGDGAILWLQAQDALFAGLLSAEWVIAPADGSSGIGPTNITAHRQSRWGSNQNIPAVVAGDALVFVQRQGYSARQMLYSVVTNKYMSQDLTALSDQIMNGGAIQMAYQKQGQKNGFLWVTTANGEMVAMTYELDQEIFGWHRHYTGLGTDAGFEGVATIHGKGTNDDEVWVVVNRMIGGVATRFMERLNPINWQTVIPQPGQTPGYGPDKDWAYHVDCGQTYVQPATNVFTGLGYLNGRTVSVCINAQDYGTFVVDGGQITVPAFTPPTDGSECIAHVGLPFPSILQPMNLDVDVHTGVTSNVTKKVTGLAISFLNTLACTVTDGSGLKGRTKELIFRSRTEGLFSWLWALLTNPSPPLGEVPLYSGIYQVKDFCGDYGVVIPVIIYTSGPLPLTVLGVAVDYSLSSVP